MSENDGEHDGNAAMAGSLATVPSDAKACLNNNVSTSIDINVKFSLVNATYNHRSSQPHLDTSKVQGKHAESNNGRFPKSTNIRTLLCAVLVHMTVDPMRGALGSAAKLAATLQNSATSATDTERARAFQEGCAESAIIRS